MKKIKKELRRMKDDINREKSIEEMTNKAQDVKEELIQKIRDFLNNGIEIIFGQVEEFKSEFLKESLSLGINFESEADMEKLKQDIISYLNNLQVRIAETDVSLESENQLKAFEKIDKYEGELEEKIANISEIPMSYFKKGMQQISNKRIQRAEYQSQKNELEKEEMYLKGKLDTVIIASKKEKIQQKIEEIRLKIREIDNKMLELNKKALEENDDNHGLKRYVVTNMQNESNESTVPKNTTLPTKEFGEK